MIRVLHIMACSDAGGISSVVLNFYRHIDRTKVHFDIGLTVPPVGQNGRALEELGARIFMLPLKSENLTAFRTELEALLRQENYDAIHVHESETSYVALAVAKKLGIPCRIAHSHTTSPWEGIKGELRRLSGCVLNYHYATCVMGCGQKAGERVFGKYNMKRPKAVVIPNAVDTGRFAFDEQVRREVRQELGLGDSFVIGMVGRLSEEKNPGYGLELMPRLLERCPDAMLVMAGNGPEEERLKQRIAELDLGRHVKLLGRRVDVDRLYQAFDLYLLPSFTEGFPVAAVEAMASGLPVLLSDAITRELEFGSAVTYLPLAEPDCWVREMLKWRTDDGRTARQKEPKENGLDIRSAAKRLEQIYAKGLHENAGYEKNKSN